MVQFLTKIGCNIHKKNTMQNCTCFCYACGSTEISLVKFLINLGCNINEVDGNGRSALLHAIHTHHNPMEKFLIDKKKHLHLIEFLISSGCDIHTKDDDGNNAVQIAFQDGFIEATLNLIEYGCAFSKILSVPENNDGSRKEKQIYQRIQKRIKEIEKPERVMKHILQDVDIQMIDLISEFSFGLQNLKNVILLVD